MTGNSPYSFLSFALDVIDEGLVAETRSAGRGIVAREIPVAFVMGNGAMQSFDRLVDQFDGRSNALRTEHLDNLLVDFLHGERFVEGSHTVLHLGGRLLQFSHTFFIYIVDKGVQATLFEQRDGGPEHAELFQSGHVDAVIVGVADLGRAAYNDDSAGVQAIEYAEDATLEGGAAHDAVVDHHKVVFAGADAFVGDVVDMRGEVVA